MAVTALELACQNLIILPASKAALPFPKLYVLFFIKPQLFLIFPNRFFAPSAHKAFPSGILLPYAAADRQDLSADSLQPFWGIA